MKVDYLLIGGGTSCPYAAASIRKVDPTRTIAIIGKETRLPYDRPPLSKQFLFNPEMKEDDPESKFPNFYPDNNIQLIPGTQVNQLNLDSHTAHLENHPDIQFGKALIATGSKARPLSVEGGSLEKVLTLRSLDDAVILRNLIAKSKSAIVIGSGYIGLETASSIASRGLKVTLITHDLFPWKSLVSQDIGWWITRQFEQKDIQFQFGTSPSLIEESGDQVKVHTANGSWFAADFVLAGIGAEPNLDLAKKSGLTVEKNGVLVNSQLQTSHPDVYACGDISLFEDPVSKKLMRAEHHLNAVWQAETVGKNLTGAGEKYDKIAYFYSDIFDIHMAFRGCPTDAEPTTVLGEIGPGNFIELWQNKDKKLVAGTIISDDESALDPISDKLEALIRQQPLIDTVKTSDLGL